MVKSSAKKAAKPKPAPATPKKAKAGRSRSQAASRPGPVRGAPPKAPPSRLKLTMMTGDYEIVRALKEGRVKPRGIDIQVGGHEGGRDMLAKAAFGKGYDINEFNGGQFCMAREQGREIIGIPVFLHRRFRHGFIFVNTSAGISKPSDLIGRRVGMNYYGPAAHYWTRGHLEHDFGISHRSITYVVERGEDIQSPRIPDDLRIEMLPPGKNVEQMLLAGELDAIMSPGVPQAIAEGDPRVGHLWPDYQRIEAEYFGRTGIFPIMHVTTLPMDLVARYPWVVESLVLAFEESKQLAYQRIVNPRLVPLAWYRTYWEDERRFLGRDPWQYGLSEINRKNYDLLAGFVHEQGMTRRRMALEELFAKEAFDLQLPLPTIHKPIYDY